MRASSAVSAGLQRIRDGARIQIVRARRFPPPASGLDLSTGLWPTGTMDFGRVLRDVVGEMESAGIRYALIGGFAMALRGVQRATADLDFILSLEDLGATDAVLARHGYQQIFRSENVSHYESADQTWGRIDILHAFRTPSLGMLHRAEAMAIEPGLRIRVAQTEDIIGLKLQALCNNPARAESDWHDIRLLVRAAREQNRSLDWKLLEDYFRLFALESHLIALRNPDGPTE